MKTRGGWEAVKIWIRKDGFYVIHKPNTDYESVPIFHRNNGEATTGFSVYEAPCYGKHPADIIDFEETKDAD